MGKIYGRDDRGRFIWSQGRATRAARAARAAKTAFGATEMGTLVIQVTPEMLKQLEEVALLTGVRISDVVAVILAIGIRRA